jgi:hypothetical protein
MGGYGKAAANAEKLLLRSSLALNFHQYTQPSDSVSTSPRKPLHQ